MQREIKEKCVIPNAKGIIERPGWARKEWMEYKRNHIQAPWFRRKEWDYYLFNNDEIAVAFTISDLGYVGLLSASFIDLKEGWEYTDSELYVLPRGKAFHLDESTKREKASCKTKRLNLSFEKVGNHRIIRCEFKNFKKDHTFLATIDAYEPDMEAMYIATPWKENETAFYYNCKMNCLEAKGIVKLDDRICSLSPQNTLGVLDWGRGVWTYDNTWYWGTGSGRMDGIPFGFNLGYGFSDRSDASENALYYKGKIHKLKEVTFQIPRDGKKVLYTNPWTITSSDHRFEAIFTPILDRCDKIDYKVIVSDQHQVFGKMNGKAILDDGTIIEMVDFICALEVVHNRY